jgi:hypothetical protein
MADTPDELMGEVPDDVLDELVATELAAIDEEYPSRRSKETEDTRRQPADRKGDEPSRAAPAPAEASAEAEEVAQDEERDDAPGTQAAAPAAPASPATIPGAKPFQFKASGGMHTIPGAVELPDGSVHFTGDSRGTLLQRLASERELSANFKNTTREYTRRLKAAEAARSGKELAAEQITTLFEDFVKMTPEERWDWAQKFDENAPKYKLDFERAQLDADRAALKEERSPTPSQEEVIEQATSEVTAHLNTTFHRMMESAHPDDHHCGDDAEQGVSQDAGCSAEGIPETCPRNGTCSTRSPTTRSRSRRAR